MLTTLRHLVFASASILLLNFSAHAQEALDNAAVLKLKSAGLSESLILTTINNSPGHYSVGTDDLIALKKAGLSDNIVGAMITKNSAANMPPQAPLPGPSDAGGPPPASDPYAKPRVFLQSASKGPSQNAARDQSMEMSKDFEQFCEGVKITINQTSADYTVNLNHIEIGLLVRDNQFQIADHNGDLISKTKEGGSIAGGVKKACGLILADWGKNHPAPPPPPPTAP